MSGRAERPTIPATVWFAVGAWLAAVAVQRWLVASVAVGPERGVPIASVRVVAVACAASLLVWAALSRRPFRRVRATLGVVVAGALAGAVAAAAAGQGWIADVGAVAAGASGMHTADVLSDAGDGGFGPRVTARIVGGTLDGAVVSLSLSKDATPPVLGRRVAFAAVLKPLDLTKPSGRRAAMAGEVAQGRPWRLEDRGWRPGPLGALFAWRDATARRLARIRGPGGDLLQGVLLGDRRRVAGTPTEDDFRTLGLSHLLAVSGDYLALISIGLGAVLRAAGASRRAQWAGTLGGGTAFAVVTGLQMSCIRALGMVAAFTLCRSTGRRVDPLAALAVAVTAVLVVDPWAAQDLGFRLSAAAVGGLAAFGSLADAWTTAVAPRLPEWVRAPVSLTLVAQATTAPLTLPTFGMLSLAAPLANAVVVPLVGPALVLGLVGAAVATIVPALGLLVLRFASMLLALSAAIAGRLAAVPGAAVALSADAVTLCVATLLALVVLWILWPSPSLRAVRAARILAPAACLALALGAPVAPASIVVLDVGQGDAILVRDGPHAVLVDAGPSPTVLRKALGRAGIRHLDAVILTHAHDDHVAGLAGLVGVVRVGKVCVPEVAEPEAFASSAAVSRRLGVPALTPVRAGATMDVGSWKGVVLWPVEPDSALSTNDTSVVMTFSRGRLAVVLTGDAEQTVQRRLIDAGTLSAVDVLKVPHHGSTNGLCAEGLDGWRPRDALISVGEGNRFGHPEGETLALLASRSVRTHRTDLLGDLTIRPAGEGCRISASGRSTADRGTRAVGQWHARSQPGCGAPAAPRPSVTDPRGAHGLADRSERPQARLPHLRHRGAAAGARGPPAQGAGGRGRRSRLQLPGVRR